VGSGERAVTRLPVRKEDLRGLAPDRYGRAEIARMLDAADPEQLLAAAARWADAAGLLDGLHDDLRARAEVLAAGWDGAAAGACQHALRRVAATARQLSRYAGDLRAALSAAAEAQHQAKRQLAVFRAHPTLLGGIEVGGTGDRLLAEVADPELAAHLDQTARQWLRGVYDGYRAALAALPDQVAFDLPGLAAPELPAHATAGEAGQRPLPAPAGSTEPPGSPQPVSPPAGLSQPAGPQQPSAQQPVGPQQPGWPPLPDRPAPVGSDPAAPTPAEVLGTAAAAATGAIPAAAAGAAPADPLPDAAPAVESAGASYGGTVDPAGTVLAGGIGGGSLPLDPGQPDGGSWQGAAAPPGHGTGPAVEEDAGSAGGRGTPPGPLADIGAVVGAVAEAVAGSGQQPPGPDQPVPGMQATDSAPTVDAPYIAATVAEAVAAAAHQEATPADQGDAAPGAGPGEQLPDAHRPGGTDDLPDADPAQPH
jgi:WXG100 family type VII secretion target